jgi:hypothetical protein
MSIRLCCPVTCCQLYCSSSVCFFFKTVFNVWRSLSVSVDLRPQFLFADAVFPWFLCGDITLETVAFDTLIMWQLSQLLHLNVHQRSVAFKIGQVSYFSILSHGLSLNTITNAVTRELQCLNKWKKNIQWCQLKYFQCSQHKRILFLNFLVFPLFCSPL